MMSAFNDAAAVSAKTMLLTGRLSVSDIERSQLWQQRLAEAVFGMTVHLIEKREPSVIFDWLAVQSDIFSNLPASGAEDANAWMQIFFRAQALCEKFLIARCGHDELANWTRVNAWVHERLEVGQGGGAADVANRIARQAELYDSEYDLRSTGYAEAEIAISHCAIWDYREKARARGVPITLRSPCEYCTKAIASNAAAKGYQSQYQLISDGTHHGCEWRIYKSATLQKSGQTACAESSAG
ncbi:hypothetical protein [Rhodomicrobium lacus]|uniref:hypothetical protein n=1 Tax=Rhodomicrobium lacus TaxID=2498452 RepID=UPI000F8F04B8|nr:hypothetical protein [Rhodomicrobium lacus]